MSEGLSAIDRCVLYALSIVRRRADCASRDKPSASLMTTTVVTIQLQRLSREVLGVVLCLTLKLLLRIQVNLLCLRDLLEDVLNDRAIPVTDVARMNKTCKSSRFSDTGVPM